MTSAASPRVLIIGLDGADWSLLKPLMDDGAMPALRALVEQGASATLESVRPTNSMSAWTSLMTGVNPAKHGVFDFVRKSKTPYQTSVTNSSAIRFPTMWETLSGAGMASCVIDMPPLYPPYAVENVVMIGGIGAMTAAGRAYASPADAAKRVEDAVGAFLPDVAWVGKSGQQEQLLEELITLVDNRRQVTEFFLADRPWDVLCSVFVAPDRVQHVFWQDLTERGAHYSAARRFYVKLDEALAQLLDRIDTTTTDVFVVSDHGFRPSRRTFEVSQFLLETLKEGRGWEVGLGMPMLRFIGLHVPLPRGMQRGLIDMNGKLRRRALVGLPAYSDTSDAVYVNLAGRETSGNVPQERYDKVRELVERELLAFRDPRNGQPVVRRVIPREEYFHGEHAGEAPDLLLEFHDGYSHGSLMGAVLFDWPYCQGVHSLSGIVAAVGPHIRSGTEASTVSIMDVAPTVLSLLGVAAPEGVDGRPAESLLAGPVEAGARVPGMQPARRAEEPSAYSEEEEALVRERLRGLGYIE